MNTPCLFCGGDAAAVDHWRRCDGQQGHVEHEEPFDPLLISGATADTWATSEAAAVGIEDAKNTQRAIVYAAIRAAGIEGRTDDELQEQLGLDGSSERPRRWELWKQERICIRRDSGGQAVRRRTRTNRSAVVWITTQRREA